MKPLRKASPVGSAWNRRLQGTTALYSLLWLLAANLVGLWLAAILIWPQWGQLAGEFTYGRWMPLHMDWQLYGWCALPLVGLLMRYFLNEKDGSDAHLGFIAWSVALALGGILSLNGVVSGKLFLNWAGWGRVAFPVAQVVLWAMLLRASFARWRCIGKMDTKQVIQAVLLVLLLISPISLFWTAGAQVYPPIDPESGGATGHSLLASSLGILAIFGLLPLVLQVPFKRRGFTCEDRRATAADTMRSSQVKPLRLPFELRWGRIYLGSFIASVGAWSFLDHGNASNTQLGQILGLGLLLLWVPLLYQYYRSYLWPAPLRLWLGAFLFWWGFLTVSGFISFLPGVLDVMKFTNGLVAHAHLAMAGMMGALNMLVLGSLGRAEAGDPWSDRAAFWLWQLGTLIYVISMLFQGVREGLDPTVLFGANAGTTALYGIRLFAGALLVAANVRWLCCLERVRRGRSHSSFAALACGGHTFEHPLPTAMTEHCPPLNTYEN
ncbi:hypothetical protein ACWPKS_11825 [Coraliomargarita sp. W4R72]